jgi:hypothetical protein
MLTTIRFFTPSSIPEQLVRLGAVPGAQDERAVNLHVEDGVLITGRPGSGKTLNLTGICEAAARDGYTVIRLDDHTSVARYRAASEMAGASDSALIVIDEGRRLGRSNQAEEKIEIIRGMRSSFGGRPALVVAAESAGSLDPRLLTRMRTHIDQDDRAIDGMPRILRAGANVLEHGEWVKAPEPRWYRDGYAA